MPFLFPKVKDKMKQYRNPDTAYKKKMKILSLDTTASPGVKTIQHQATVKSDSSGTPGSYTTTIRFHDIRLSKEPRNKNDKQIKVGDVTYFYKQPSIKRSPVQIKCTCQDFRFSFEKQNFDAKGLIGNWRRYQRKTPPKKRPARAKNPNKDGKDFVNANPRGGDDVTGFCKHIYSLLLALRSKDEVKN
jgi:hypothetical protein